MESISVGIPVIAYKVGGLKEVIIDDVTGMLVEKNDIKSMSASVKEILLNQELYKTMSYNAIKDWELRFYSESIKKQIFDVLV
jgi:glycosyltransferase involved in cell wall biosynthesis